MKLPGKEAILDCHSHSGAVDRVNKIRNFYPWVQHIERFKKKLDMNQVWGAITFPFPNTAFYDPNMYINEKRLVPSGNQSYPYEKENKELIAQCRGTENLFPFACIDPKHHSKRQLLYLESLMGGRKQQIYGLKMHCYAVQEKPQALIETGFVDFALKHNLPILFHSGVDNHSLAEKSLALAKQFPELRVCIAHFAQFKVEVLEQVNSLPNVFIDTCPLLYLQDMAAVGSKWVQEPNLINIEDPALTLLAYYQLLGEKLMWGTDEPWTKMVTPDGVVQSDHNYEEEVQVLKGLQKMSPQIVKNIANINILNFLFG